MKREPIWWLPLLRRVLVWGVAMALIWGFAVSMALLVPIVAVGSWAIAAGAAPKFALVARSLAPLLPYFCGGVLGMLGGFFAPTFAPTNPLRSEFLREVAFDTFLLCLLANFVLTVTVAVALQFVPTTVLARNLPLLLGCFLAVFALSLWRALNRALAAKAAR